VVGLRITFAKGRIDYDLILIIPFQSGACSYGFIRMIGIHNSGINDFIQKGVDGIIGIPIFYGEGFANIVHHAGDSGISTQAA